MAENRGIFRNFPEISTGSGLAAHGIIYPREDLEGQEPVRDGIPQARFYSYVGDSVLPCWDVLTHRGEQYLVLRTKEHKFLGKLFCAEALLEKLGDPHGE